MDTCPSRKPRDCDATCPKSNNLSNCVAIRLILSPSTRFERRIYLASGKMFSH
jgi:hypothetical protein